MSIRKMALLVMGMSFSHMAWAAPTLMVGKVTGKAGTEAVLPISFDPGGSKVTAAQFSLVLPPELSGDSISLGETGNQAGKIVTAKQVGQKWNVIIMGMNQTPMVAGVLANATLKISSSAKPGKLAVKIEKPIFSDGAGESVAAGSSKVGSIKVTSSAP